MEEDLTAFINLSIAAPGIDLRNTRMYLTRKQVWFVVLGEIGSIILAMFIGAHIAMWLVDWCVF